jgi:hypothetical protein
MAGFYEGSDLSNKTFYGFRLDPDTGNLNVEIINDGTSAVVLPQDDIIDKYDYKQWVWSQNTLDFQWDKGHLQVKMI